MAYSGRFQPRNPHKYEGDHRNIIYRSLWELKCMKKFDVDDNVVSWSSEELIIPYFSEIDGKNHRYFPDFKATMRDINSGILTTYIIEIKPHGQVMKPKDPGRRSTRYINECRTWISNQTKWKYAEAFAAARGWKFHVMTEYDIGIKKRK